MMCILTTIHAFFACDYLCLQCLFSSFEPGQLPYKPGLPYHILFAHLCCICPWCFCGLGVHVQHKIYILNVWNLFYKSFETLTVNHKVLKSRDFVFYFSCIFSLRYLVLCSLEASDLVSSNWMTSGSWNLQFFGRWCADNSCRRRKMHKEVSILLRNKRH